MSTAGSLAEVHPELMKGFTALDSSSGRTKHLDAKTRELIAPSAGVALVYPARVMDAFADGR